MQSLISAIESIWCGDFTQADAYETKANDPWVRLAFDAHRQLAGISLVRVKMQHLRAAAAPNSSESFVSCAVATAAVAKLGAINFERDEVVDAAVFLETTLASWTNNAARKPAAQAWLSSVQAWSSLIQDQDPGELLEHLYKEAKQLGDAPLVIEVAALRALAAERLGNWDDAREHARRASRMGRTESFPQQEYLANLVLARIRRVNGVSHYGIRILSALKRVLPPVWHRWLRWEARLSGADIEPKEDAASLVDRLVQSAEQGERETFDALAHACISALSGFPLLKRDAVALCAMLDPLGPLPETDGWLAAFLRGTIDDSAFGLASATGKHAENENSSPGTCWLLVSPGRPSRRFLHPGLGFLSGHPQLGETHRRQSRLRSATCALAVSPQGLSDPELFTRVFGFPFEHEEHHGVLRVTLHRLRKQLAEFAEIVGIDDRRHLKPAITFVVADPYATTSPADRILKWVGGRPGGSAKDAARALGMNLRTVQHELQQLVEDGVCSAQRDGRALSYWIEDTTFREPTQVSTAK